MSTYMRAPTGEIFTTESPHIHADCTQLPRKAGEAAHMEYARAGLRKLLPPGSIVYCILQHVSRSGMMRHIKLAIVQDGEIRDISYTASIAVSKTQAGNGGIKVSGCGMDMGFALVYALSHALYPHGFDCMGDRCPSNDHSNREHPMHHASGGHALKHEWL